MVPRISKKAKLIFGNLRATEALSDAIENNRGKIDRGEPVYYIGLFPVGDELKERKVYIRKGTAL